MQQLVLRVRLNDYDKAFEVGCNHSGKISNEAQSSKLINIDYFQSVEKHLQPLLTEFEGALVNAIFLLELIDKV